MGIHCFSCFGDCDTEAWPIYLPLWCTLSVRSRHCLPGNNRDMRAVAGERFRSPQIHVNQEYPPDRVRSVRSRGGDLCQHRGHSELLSVNESIKREPKSFAEFLVEQEEAA